MLWPAALTRSVYFDHAASSASGGRSRCHTFPPECRSGSLFREPLTDLGLVTAQIGEPVVDTAVSAARFGVEIGLHAAGSLHR